MNRRQRRAARRRAVQAWRKPTAPLLYPLSLEAAVLAAGKAVTRALVSFLAASAAAQQGRNETKH